MKAYVRNVNVSMQIEKIIIFLLPLRISLAVQVILKCLPCKQGNCDGLYSMHICLTQMSID